MYVTHDELIQIGIFIVSLIGLCYTIFESKHKKLIVARQKAIYLDFKYNKYYTKIRHKYYN